jgi:outer membrane receptor protein involved in Fe transport
VAVPFQHRFTGFVRSKESGNELNPVLFDWPELIGLHREKSPHKVVIVERNCSFQGWHDRRDRQVRQGGGLSNPMHLSELTPASSQSFPIVADPFSTLTEPQIEERILGNPNLHPEVAYEWTYGIVWSPKWVKGLTLSADWWHIDMRDIVTPLGAQFIIEQNPPPAPPAVQDGPFVFRGPNGIGPNGQPIPGPVTLVVDPSQNASGAIFEGLDYEAIYILDSSIFGHGDWGRITTTVNGTWLSRAEFQGPPRYQTVWYRG